MTSASDVRSCLDACLAACKGGDKDECAESCGECVKTLLKCDPQPPNVAGQPVGASPDVAECDRLATELRQFRTQRQGGHLAAGPGGAAGVLSPGQWTMLLSVLDVLDGLYHTWRSRQTP